MATIPQSISAPASRSNWFVEFLKEELAPYPGRGTLVARMVVAATIVMVMTMVFRIPYGAYATLFALIISRENPQATVNAVTTLIVWFSLSAAYVFVGTILFLQDPTARLFWVIGTFFVMFFALSVMTNYTAAARFGYLLIITIPLWDEHVSAEVRVENTLWAVGAIGLGSLVAGVIELVYAQLRPHDHLIQEITRRLLATEQLLGSYLAKGHVDQEAEKQVTGLALVGTSSLRRDLQRSDYSPRYAEQMGAVAVLVGRLVDVAANPGHLALPVSDQHRKRVQSLSENIAAIREDLSSGRIPRLVHSDFASSPELPLVTEMEELVRLIGEAFIGSADLSAYGTPASTVVEPPRKFFVQDALSNSKHIKFALRGCLAASLCYIIYNGKDWPGISTAVTTCFLTALSTVGSSHQKQILRITGAFVGGIVLGIGAQTYVLPYIDSITGFTLLFLAVSILAAWIATAGPRLSYFGVQVAVAFYLVNLSEFKVQTSLELGRDRVLGIFLGLLMMWLAFDRVGGVSAVVEMTKTFVSNFRLLAQFTIEPLSDNLGVAVKQANSLRENINNNFDSSRSAADGVKLEFGSSRKRDLAWREKIVRWQLQVRSIFLLQAVLWKFRAQLEGFELPALVREAQRHFDNQSAAALQAFANRMEGKVPSQPPDLHEALERLEQTIRDSAADSRQSFSRQMQTVLVLSRRTAELMSSLNTSIGPAEQS
jgi:multidrug resistance protein MdtO